MFLNCGKWGTLWTPAEGRTQWGLPSMRDRGRSEQAHAAGLEVTMHMAFDELDAVAQRVAIEELAALGVERVLTHGGSAGVPIEKTLPHLKEIVSWANGRLSVLPGGGVTRKNAELVAGELGVSEVHGTRVVPLA